MTAPLGTEEFASLMAACGPFEDRPHLAAAVSGGADSMSPALLLASWAKARGGRVTALTVDHGLRAESGSEAARVGDWMRSRGINHDTLVWRGAKPAHGVQAAARAARYDLLLDWCRGQDVLNLVVAHHREDQAETVRIRADRGSGDRGLAGMAAVSPPPRPGPRWPRLLRPLLEVGKARLRATLEAAGQPWIEDPSNENAAYRRVAVRRQLEGREVDQAALSRLARDARLRWEAAEDALLTVLAPAVRLHPAGFATFDADWLNGLSDDLATDLWQRLFVTIGGSDYPPRGEALARLVQAARKELFKGATVAGCRILCRGRLYLVTREPAAAREERPFADGLVWDRRFILNGRIDGPATVRRLDENAWRLCRARGWNAPLAQVPHAVRLSLPAIYQGEAFLGVPSFTGMSNMSPVGVEARLAPAQPLVF